MLLNTEVESNHVTIRAGIKIPFVEHGARDRIPVVMLHGYTDSWWSFDPVLPLLPLSIRAIALSQRGHGDADRPLAGYRASDLATDLASFLDALAIESAVIVGHSMGSYIAQRFALDYPRRTRALVLAGSYPTARGNAGIDELMAAVAALTDPVDPGFVRAFQEARSASRSPRHSWTPSLPRASSCRPAYGGRPRNPLPRTIIRPGLAPSQFRPLSSGVTATRSSRAPTRTG